MLDQVGEVPGVEGVAVVHLSFVPRPDAGLKPVPALTGAG